MAGTRERWLRAAMVLVMLAKLLVLVMVRRSPRPWLAVVKPPPNTPPDVHVAVKVQGQPTTLEQVYRIGGRDCTSRGAAWCVGKLETSKFPVWPM